MAQPCEMVVMRGQQFKHAYLVLLLSNKLFYLT